MKLWPVGIFEDRYSGTYSGGKWVAIGRVDHDSFLKFRDYQWDGDFECSNYWSDERKALAGQGDTPQEALDDLIRKAEANDNWTFEWIDFDNDQPPEASE